MKIADVEAFEELIQLGRQYQAAQQRLADAERMNNPYEREAALEDLTAFEDDFNQLQAVMVEIDEALQQAQDGGDLKAIAAGWMQKGMLLARLDRQEEGLVCFETALAQLEGREADPLFAEIGLRRALTLGEMGRMLEAEEAFDQLLQALGPEAAAASARLLGHKGELYLALGQNTRAEETFNAALETLGEGQGEDERLRLWRGLARAHQGEGDLRRAVEILTAALDSAEASGASEEEWEIVRDLLDAEIALGVDMERVLALCDRAQRLAEERGDHREAAIQRENAITALLKLNRPEQALVLLHESLDYVRRRGPRMKKLVLLMQLGRVNFDLGRWDRSESAYQEALDEAKDQNNPRSMAVTLGRLGALYAEQGKLEAARRYGELALDKVEEGREPEIMAELQILLAMTYQDLDERELAQAACTKAADLYGLVGQEEMASQARQLLGELAA